MPEPRNVHHRSVDRSGKLQPVEPATALYKPQRDTGHGLQFCPVCGREVARRADGQLRSHRAGVRPNNWLCPGASASHHR